MKAILIIYSIFLILFTCGCAKRKTEIQFHKEDLPKLESSDVTKVYFRIDVIKSEPNKMSLAYDYEYPIDYIKGRVILRCIKEANYIDYDNPNRPPRREMQIAKGQHCRLFFETKKFLYSANIAWDDESVYGYWWESKDLLSIFRGWGLFDDLMKVDPNWPSYNKKWPEPNRSSGHRMNEKEYMEYIGQGQDAKDVEYMEYIRKGSKRR